MVTPAELKKLLRLPRKGGPLLIDVREPDEFEEWRIEESTNIPMEKLMSSSGIKSISRRADIVAICGHGIRSAEAANFLRKKGFAARSLAGGMTAWSKLYDNAPIALRGIDNLRLIQLRRLGKGCASYLLSCDGEGVVVDPSILTENYLSAARERGVKIRYVLDTHQHADHISGARALAHACGAELYLNPLDTYRFREFNSILDGDRILIGGEVAIEAILSPGHTKGSTCFLVGERILLTGDILFTEGIARPDLHEKAEEFAEQLYQTYKKLFERLPGEILVLPAHFSRAVKIEFGKPFFSTLGELHGQFSILEASKSEFIGQVLRRIPPTPPNYQAILKINQGETAYDPELADELEEGPNRCALRV